MIAITKPWALYNEIEPYAADWLENLIARGAIASGVVDRRSIEDLTADELRGFRQVHFFAGIGVWSYALRRAGVADDTALWTGSCPCQPFSAAGKGGGVADERHLWPAWHHLIRECRPREVFGEQVASKDGLGWLDLVSSDMEASDYAFWAVDSCSAGSGAPHIRQRLRFAAYDRRSAAGGLSKSQGEGFSIGARPASAGSQFPELGFGDSRLSGRLADLRDERRPEQFGGWIEPSGLAENSPSDLLGVSAGARSQGGAERRQRPDAQLTAIERAGTISGMADMHLHRCSQERSGESAPWYDGPVGSGTAERVACGYDDERRTDISQRGPQGRTSDGGSGPALWMADNECVGWEWGEGSENGNVSDREVAIREEGVGGIAEPDQTRSLGHNGGPEWAGPTNGFWRDADWLFGRDGKWRPVEPGTFPLVDGSAFRMGSGSAFEGKSRQGMLRGYGNAIDAEATIDFLAAYLERDLIDIEHEPVRGDDPFADLLG